MNTMIPEDSGGPYVIAAYLVFLVLIAVYVAIMAQRLTKIAKSADELQARLDAVQGSGAGAVQGDVHAGDHQGAAVAGGQGAAANGNAASTTPATPAGGTGA